MSPLARLSRTKPLYALTHPQLDLLDGLHKALREYDSHSWNSYDLERGGHRAWGLEYGLHGWLRQAWCYDLTCLGYGAFSYVFEHPDFPGMVIKLGVGGTTSSWNYNYATRYAAHLSDAWLPFGLYCAARPDLAYLPGIAFIGVYDAYYIAVMEKLECREHRALSHSTMLYEHVCNKPNSGIVSEREFQEWAGVMRTVRSECPGNWDLHTGNIRYRGDQLVLMDPFSGCVNVEASFTAAKKCHLCEWQCRHTPEPPKYNPELAIIRPEVKEHAQERVRHIPAAVYADAAQCIKAPVFGEPIVGHKADWVFIDEFSPDKAPEERRVAQVGGVLEKLAKPKLADLAAAYCAPGKIMRDLALQGNVILNWDNAPV